MRAKVLLTWLIVLFMIIGGVLIVIINRPQPICIKCIQQLINMLGGIQVALGAITLGVQQRVFGSNKSSQIK